MRLTEGYKEKLNAVANKIIQDYSSDGFDSKKDMFNAIRIAARHLDIAEYRLGTDSKAWKDFVKDVLPLIKGKVKIASPLKGVKRGPQVPWRDPKILQDVASEIESAAGNAFPDGDPFDMLMPELKSMGVEEHAMYKVLDMAAKQYLGANSYNDYLSDMWDSVYDDAKYDYEQWRNADPAKRGQEPHMYKALGGDRALNPWKVIGEGMKFTKSLGESLENYDNKIETAIAELLNVKEEEGKAIADKMDFQDYIDFAMAIDTDDTDEAFIIVHKYSPSADVADHPEMATMESVAQSMHYLIKRNEDNVLVPGLKYLNEMQQRDIVAEMNVSEMQKILANLRGFNEPGTYERSLFTVQLIEEIIIKLKNTKISHMLEAGTLAPGKQQQMQAYGAKDTEVAPTAVNNKKTATFTNDQGEQEQGEVVSSAGNNVNIRTSTGVKSFKKDDVMMPINEAGISPMGKFSQSVIDKLNSSHNFGTDMYDKQWGSGARYGEGRESGIWITRVLSNAIASGHNKKEIMNKLREIETDIIKSNPSVNVKTAGGDKKAYKIGKYYLVDHGHAYNVVTRKKLQGWAVRQTESNENNSNIIRLKELAGIKVQESKASERVLAAINSYEAGKMSKEELYNTIREEYPGVSIDTIMRQLEGDKAIRDRETLDRENRKAHTIALKGLNRRGRP